MNADMRLLAKASGLSDIIKDMIDMKAEASWISHTWLSRECLEPVQLHPQHWFMPRGHVLSSMLMLYRRCFSSGHRFRIPESWIQGALGNFEALHRDLISRADDLVAHAISASSATSAKVAGGRILYSSFRPGHNSSDYDNLVALVDQWLPTLEQKLSEIEDQILDADVRDDDYPAECFVAPWGSGIDQQSLATGRPAERTRNVLSARAKRKDKGEKEAGLI